MKTDPALDGMLLTHAERTLPYGMQQRLHVERQLAEAEADRDTKRAERARAALIQLDSQRRRQYGER